MQSRRRPSRPMSSPSSWREMSWALRTQAKVVDPEHVLEDCAAQRVEVVTHIDPTYPALLAERPVSAGGDLRARRLDVLAARRVGDRRHPQRDGRRSGDGIRARRGPRRQPGGRRLGPGARHRRCRSPGRPVRRRPGDRRGRQRRSTVRIRSRTPTSGAWVGEQRVAGVGVAARIAARGLALSRCAIASSPRSARCSSSSSPGDAAGA